MSREECEARAYQAANAMLSERSNNLKEGDSVIWRDDKGVQCRGRVKGYCAADNDKQADGLENDNPLLEVERWKPVRDGWQPSGQVVKVAPGDCHKTETLFEPQKPSHKETPMKADIQAFVDAALKSSAAPIGDASIKRIDNNVIGGYAVRWGSDVERDVENDWFSKSTDLWLDVYQNQPLIWDHASGVELPPDPDWPDDEQDNPRRYKIGTVTKSMKDDIGLWIEATLDAHNKWKEGILELIDKGVLGFSSGSVPHLIKRAPDGMVESWPFIELSTTASPAEPRNTEVRHLSLAGGKSSQLEVIDVPSSSTASLEARPDGAQAPAVSRSVRTINNVSTKHKQTHHSRSKEMNVNRRLSHLVAAHWNSELAATASAYAAAVKSVKAEGELPEDSQTVQDAASQLDQLVQPIAEQAKSALGIDVDEAKSMLLKACLARITKQMPGVEEEDYLEEGNPDEMPLDEYVDAESDPAAEMLPLPEDEEDILPPAATMSARRSADITNAVRRELASFGAGRGIAATKSGPTIMVRKPENRDMPIGAVIKAFKDKNHAVMHAYKTRNASNYKALGLNPDSSGGFLVEPEYTQEIIELLRAKSVFMRVNNVEGGGVGESLVTTIPMNSDTMYIPTQTGAATAYWIGENTQIPDSQQAFGQKQLVARKMAARVIVGNELLDDTTTDLDMFIRDDISQQMSVAIDDAILYGDGAGSNPRGVWHTAGVTNTALNALPTYDALVAAITRLELADVPEDNSWRWIFNPRAKQVIRGIEDTSGQLIFTTDALSAGTQTFPQSLLGYQWISTTRVHRVAGPPEEFDVFLARWKDVVIGLRKSIEIVASDVAGTTFENDQTAIRAIMRLDVALRHPESVEILSEVRSS